MRTAGYAAVLALFLSLLPLVAQAARLVALVDLSQQRMAVYVDGELHYSGWAVSTARRGKVTPTGTYQPQSLSRYHRSSIYNNAPMPYSIFFRGNYAIHGTNQISRLGSPASAGCVRLHPDNASILFDLVREIGFDETRIIIRR